MAGRLGRLIRFGMVGVANTAIDVSIFTVLHSLFAVPLFTANLLSTSVAIGASYLMNARFTFASKSITRKQIILYVLITIIGQWLLQPFVITLNLHIISVSFLHDWLQATQALVIAKLGGVAVTMVWNFVLYSKLVFTKKSPSASLTAES